MLSAIAPEKFVLTLQSVPPFFIEGLLAFALAIFLAVPLVVRIQNFFVTPDHGEHKTNPTGTSSRRSRRQDRQIIIQYPPVAASASGSSHGIQLHPIRPMTSFPAPEESLSDLRKPIESTRSYDYDHYRYKLIERNLKRQYGNRQAPGDVILTSLHLSSIDSQTGIKLSKKYDHSLFDFIEEAHLLQDTSQQVSETTCPRDYFLPKASNNERPKTAERATETASLTWFNSEIVKQTSEIPSEVPSTRPRSSRKSKTTKLAARTGVELRKRNKSPDYSPSRDVQTKIDTLEKMQASPASHYLPRRPGNSNARGKTATLDFRTRESGKTRISNDQKSMKEVSKPLGSFRRPKTPGIIQNPGPNAPKMQEDDPEVGLRRFTPENLSEIRPNIEENAEIEETDVDQPINSTLDSQKPLEIAEKWLSNVSEVPLGLRGPETRPVTPAIISPRPPSRPGTPSGIPRARQLMKLQASIDSSGLLASGLRPNVVSYLRDELDKDKVNFEVPVVEENPKSLSYVSSSVDQSLSVAKITERRSRPTSSCASSRPYKNLMPKVNSRPRSSGASFDWEVPNVAGDIWHQENVVQVKRVMTPTGRRPKSAGAMSKKKSDDVLSVLESILDLTYDTSINYQDSVAQLNLQDCSGVEEQLDSEKNLTPSKAKKNPARSTAMKRSRTIERPSIINEAVKQQAGEKRSFLRARSGKYATLKVSGVNREKRGD